MITTDSTTADNHESTLGTGTNDLENDTGAHTNMYSGRVEAAFGLFDNSIDTSDITANISGSNYDHESCVDDELLSNCDTKRVLMMKLILIVTLRRRLMMKLIIIVTLRRS